MAGFLNELGKVAKNLFDVDTNKLAKAFSGKMTEATQLGMDAVIKSRADSSKSILKMAINNDAFKDNPLMKTAQKALDSGSYEQINKAAENIARKSGIQDEVFQKAAKEFTDNSKAYSDIIKKGKNPTIAEMNAFLGKEGDKLGFGTKMSGFFGNEELGGLRKKTVAGAVAGTAIGVRYLSGGNLTTNARGEHDIAGIPFF